MSKWPPSMDEEKQMVTQAVAARPTMSPAEIALFKRMYAKDATDDELSLFLAVARHRGLDPLSGQIVFVKRGQLVDGQWQEVGTFQVTIEGYRSVADATGDYAPGELPEYEYDKEGKLFACTASVRVWRHGSWILVKNRCLYSEFVQTKKDGSPRATWAKMPHNQLAKCTEAGAIRKAFPQQTEGFEINAGDEETPPPPVMNGKDHTTVVEGTVVKVTPAPAAPAGVPQFANRGAQLTWVRERGKAAGWAPTELNKLSLMSQPELDALCSSLAAPAPTAEGLAAAAGDVLSEAEEVAR